MDTFMRLAMICCLHVVMGEVVGELEMGSYQTPSNNHDEGAHGCESSLQYEVSNMES